MNRALYTAGVQSGAVASLAFAVKSVGGWFLALSVGFSCRRDVASFLWKFRKARRAVPRASRSCFGMCFARGSLRWVASFSSKLLVVAPPSGRGRCSRRFNFEAPALLPRAGVMY